MNPSGQGPRGRGALDNPPNRFEPLALVPDAEEGAPASPATRFLRDETRSVLSRNESPDIPFEYSLNPYRGCEHGCAYCYARPTHEYLGFSAGLDFETRIVVKERAPELLERALASPRWWPNPVALSGVTDPYQPVEARLGITRRCLEVLARFRHPVTVVTKNHLVTRDADLLRSLAAHRAVSVFLSIATLDAGLARRMEPRASAPGRRLAAVEALARAGVPVGVLVAPVVPGLTEHEIPRVLRAAAAAGARSAGYVVLRLPHGVKGIFQDWLRCHFPGRAAKVLGRVRALHGGRLNDPAFGSRMRGEGVFAAQIDALFRSALRQAGLAQRRDDLSGAAFRRPSVGQMELFD